MKKSSKFFAFRSFFLRDPWPRCAVLLFCSLIYLLIGACTYGRALKPLTTPFNFLLSLIPEVLYLRLVAQIALYGGYIPLLWGTCMRHIAAGGRLDNEMKEHTNLNEKTVLITGGNTGIGLEIGKQCAKWGGRVIISSRDEVKCQKAVEEIVKTANIQKKDCEYILLDLADFNSIKSFADEIKKRKIRIDYLCLNAGVMVCPYGKTKQGFEMQTGTNHMGHFFLLYLLLDDIKKWDTRVIITSSGAHSFWRFMPELEPYPFDFIKHAIRCEEKDYLKERLYSLSKFLNILTTKHLQKLLSKDSETGAVAYTLHPGAVMTELQRHMTNTSLYLNKYTCKTASEGAATNLYLIAEWTERLQPGGYYCDCQLTDVIAECYDEEFAENVWNESAKICEEFLQEQSK